jgi:fructose-bisphosphate aldolase class II
MPIANPETYAEMIRRAKEGGFAYPAINVTSSQTLNAAIKGFADAGSDGIVQASTGGAEYWSGQGVKNMVAGAEAMAAYAQSIAAHYDVNIALHTDHCPKDKLPTYMEPLLEISIERVKNGKDPLFGSHMWDGSAVPLDENIEICKRLFDKCVEAKIILECEIGVVGGEEDGIVGEINEKLYTTPEDTWKVIEALGPSGERGTYLVAATFGNVHGVYKPGTVKLRPKVLDECQQDAAQRLGGGDPKPFNFVFHGGSGSTPEEIAEALSYGTVKMNIDTDTQYSFTRPVAGHMFSNYDGVLKVDGGIGNKKAYDPRAWGKLAENEMAARVVQACQELKSAGTSLGKS